MTLVETGLIALEDIGAFQFFLPFMLFSIILYGLFRKSEIFGKPEKNVCINLTVSLIMAFMITASPIILGINFNMTNTIEGIKFLHQLVFGNIIAIHMVFMILFLLGYGILSKSKFLGENVKQVRKMNLVISLIFALLAIGFLV